MKLLWCVILLDCISTYFIVEIKGGVEINPVISWMIPYVGVVGMLLIKLAITYLLLGFFENYCKKNLYDYNKYARWIAYSYIFVWSVIVILANLGVVPASGL